MAFLDQHLDLTRHFFRGTHDCWILILVLLNLPPETRVKNNNIWILAAFPGPKQPKRLDTFLQPFVDELARFNGKKTPGFGHSNSLN